MEERTTCSLVDVVGRGCPVAYSPVTPSNSPSSQMVWADASFAIGAACTDLLEGEIIHRDNFNLFAAMSALEIMDPKMDPGVICKYCSVDEAIEDDAAPVPFSVDKTSDVHHTVDLMDHLFACEATWHNGQSLAQTVFSCIYLLKPERASSHLLLHSYCTMVRATCSELVTVVADARTNEEEDFFTMTYGLPIKVDGDEKCLSILSALDETISRQLRACKPQSNKRRTTADVEYLQNNQDMEEGYCKSLLCRLRFRKHFFHVLSCMKLPEGKGLDLARKHIVSCNFELECISMSEEFLQSASKRNRENGADDDYYTTTASGCKPVGFDSTLNCRLTGPTPPRSIMIFTWKKAIVYFRKLLQDLDFVCSFSSDVRFEGILRMIARFQRLHPDLIARAYLQCVLVRNGKFYGRDPIFSVLSKAFALDGCVQTRELRRVEPVAQLEQLAVSLIKILCANTAWQRRKLGKSVQDWCITHLQIQIAFDEKLVGTAGPILVWVEEQAYWVASRFLLLGFELDLYSPTDYCMVYWYLRLVLQKLADITNLKIAVNSFHSGRQKVRKKRSSAVSLSLFFLQCHICLCEGLFLVISALRNDGGHFQCRNLFNTEYEIFSQHFGPLQRACIPEHATYTSYKDATASVRLATLASVDWFGDGQRIAGEVRKVLSGSGDDDDRERVEEARQLEQVAEHNAVALTVISRMRSPINVSLNFTHHPYFPVLVLKH